MYAPINGRLLLGCSNWKHFWAYFKMCICSANTFNWIFPLLSAASLVVQHFANQLYNHRIELKCTSMSETQLNHSMKYYRLFFSCFSARVWNIVFDCNRQTMFKLKQSPALELCNYGNCTICPHHNYSSVLMPNFHEPNYPHNKREFTSILEQHLANSSFFYDESEFASSVLIVGDGWINCFHHFLCCYKYNNIWIFVSVQFQRIISENDISKVRKKHTNIPYSNSTTL